MRAFLGAWPPASPGVRKVARVSQPSCGSRCYSSSPLSLAPSIPPTTCQPQIWLKLHDYRPCPCLSPCPCPSPCPSPCRARVRARARAVCERTRHADPDESGTGRGTGRGTDSCSKSMTTSRTLETHRGEPPNAKRPVFWRYPTPDCGFAPLTRHAPQAWRRRSTGTALTHRAPASR